MAAPLQHAKSRLTLFQTNSKCFDLLNAYYLRHYSKSKIDTGTVKQSKKKLDLNELLDSQRTSPRDRANKLKKRAETHHAPRTLPNDKNDFFNRHEEFEQLLKRRRDEALSSVLVRTHQPENTLQKLQLYGPLEYAAFTSLERSYILAQYVERRHLESLMKGTSTFSSLNQFPMRSRCLYEMSGRSRKKGKTPFTIDMMQTYPQDRSNNSFQFQLMESFDAEILALHARKSLNEFDLRQRFFMCTLMEDSLKSLLPDAEVTPYGSCLNGFGWWDGDLDMMLSFEGYSSIGRADAANGEDTPFKFLTEVFSTERQTAQRTLSAMANIVELMPRVTRAIKILNARVPIIRFLHAALDLQCDLSLQALDSIKMTEILYLLSNADPRIRPLMTTLKQWALHHKLTSSGEQQKPTTLGLLCLLIFYLQTCQPNILPSLRELQSYAKAVKGFQIEGVYYRLPASPSVIPISANNESMESLLHGFFDFFASFNFESQAISLVEGSTFSKNDKNSPLYMENPLCIGLNICRNVSQGNLEQLQRMMKLSAQTMDDMARKSSSSSPPSRARLNMLFEQQVEDSINLSIDSLFDGEESGDKEGKEDVGADEVLDDEDEEKVVHSVDLLDNSINSDCTTDSVHQFVSNKIV